MGQGPTPLHPPLKSSKSVSVTAYSSAPMLDAGGALKLHTFLSAGMAWKSGTCVPLREVQTSVG